MPLYSKCSRPLLLRNYERARARVVQLFLRVCIQVCVRAHAIPALMRTCICAARVAAQRRGMCVNGVKAGANVCVCKCKCVCKFVYVCTCVYASFLAGVMRHRNARTLAGVAWQRDGSLPSKATYEGVMRLPWSLAMISTWHCSQSRITQRHRQASRARAQSRIRRQDVRPGKSPHRLPPHPALPHLTLYKRFRTLPFLYTPTHE